MAKAEKKIPARQSSLPPKPEPMPAENLAVKKLLWSGLVAGVGVAAAAAANRVAHAIWVKVFDEDPPFDD